MELPFFRESKKRTYFRKIREINFYTAHRVEKYSKTRWRSNNFRETNSLVASFVKPLIWRKKNACVFFPWNQIIIAFGVIQLCCYFAKTPWNQRKLHQIIFSRKKAYRFLVFPPIFFSFYRAQFQENRSIFNTPNPRLMNVSLLKDSKSYHKYSTSSTSKAGSSGSRNRSMRLSSVSSAGGIPKNGSSQHQNFSTPISSSEFDRNISSVDLQRVRLLCATAGVSIIGFRSQCEKLKFFPIQIFRENNLITGSRIAFLTVLEALQF